MWMCKYVQCELVWMYECAQCEFVWVCGTHNGHGWSWESLNILFLAQAVGIWTQILRLYPLRHFLQHISRLVTNSLCNWDAWTPSVSTSWELGLQMCTDVCHSTQLQLWFPRAWKRCFFNFKRKPSQGSGFSFRTINYYSCPMWSDLLKSMRTVSKFMRAVLFARVVPHARPLLNTPPGYHSRRCTRVCVRELLAACRLLSRLPFPPPFFLISLLCAESDWLQALCMLNTCSAAGLHPNTQFNFCIVTACWALEEGLGNPPFDTNSMKNKCK